MNKQDKVDETTITLNTSLIAVMNSNDCLENILIASNAANVHDAVNSPYETLKAPALGVYRTSYYNLLFWYKNWQKNKDYSSSINLALSLGKCSMAVEGLKSLVEEEENIHPIIASCTKFCDKVWEELQRAGGRIVPFE